MLVVTAGPFATPFPLRSALTGIVKRLSERTGLLLLCVEPETGSVVADGASELVPFIPESLRLELADLAAPAVFPLSPGFHGYAAPVSSAHGRVIAFGYQLAEGTTIPPDLVIAAARAGWSRERLSRWVAEHPRCAPSPLVALLRLAVEEIEGDPTAAVDRNDVDRLTEQLNHTYEEITLLHTLATSLQISRRPADLAALCLDRLPESINAEGYLIRLEVPGEDPRILTRGTLPFAPNDVSGVLTRFGANSRSKPLVRNGLGASSPTASAKNLRNLVAAPLGEERNRFGWIVSVNKRDGGEFGTVEANFLGTVGAILGTHVRNIDLLREQNELLLGFVRSFVSTLDAKDPYTRGHSERVALIARGLGKELGWSDEELRTIHLSGLLHDIGKIGVDDRILRKPGELTEEEFEQVKKHPTIGHSILAGLKNLRHVLPGVRNHHENFDGTGYPDGLAGDRIPPLARILAVADGYDAMGSNRPYRRGMPTDRIDEIFRRGSGRQWDPEVIDAYFRCREEIRLLCAAYSLESGCSVER